MCLYQVCRGGEVLMQTTDESCRYPAHIEAELLAAGHEIFLDGKKLKGSRRSTRAYEEGKGND